MGKLFRFLSGFVFGAAVGAGLVLLYTPQSGAETKQLLQERIDLVRAEARKAAELKRQELMAQFEALKQAAPEQ
jgi:gas vesicle protein